MRIAQVSPLYESVPPKLYGGTERVVSTSPRSWSARATTSRCSRAATRCTRAGWCRAAPRALRLDAAASDPIAPHVLMLEQVFARADDFDVIHFHIDYLHFPLARRGSVAARHDAARPARSAGPGAALPRVPRTCRWSRSPTRSAQPLPGRELAGDRLPRAARRSVAAAPAPRRLPRVPRPHLAGEARRPRDRDRARGCGMPLKIAAKVDAHGPATTSRARSSRCSTTRWSSSSARSARTRRTRSSAARAALLFPIDWPEPFGLVMIEAMACGTPVVAFRCGSVPEVMRDGVTGFIVDDDRRGGAATRARRRAAARGVRGRSRSASRRRAWRRTTSRSTRR